MHLLVQVLDAAADISQTAFLCAFFPMSKFKVVLVLPTRKPLTRARRLEIFSTRKENEGRASSPSARMHIEQYEDTHIGV